MALKVGELFASFTIDSSSIDSSIAQIEQSCTRIGSTMMHSGAALTAAVTAPVVKAAKEMYQAGTDFEAQMSKVQAIAGLDTQIEADAAAIEALTQKAIYMGSTTEWTATQAGEALQYMAMAGWSDQEMLAALEPVMHLATAAGADLGTTSDIVTDAMTAFGLTIGNSRDNLQDLTAQYISGKISLDEYRSGMDDLGITSDDMINNMISLGQQFANGEISLEQYNKMMSESGLITTAFTGDVEHFSDVLAAAATNSNTNVELLGVSFRYVAPLAGTLGMSVDDVAVALGLMANNGIKSTTAGAALRNILTGLTGNTKKTAEACEALGLSLYNDRGEVKSLAEVMGDLRGAYGDHEAEVVALQKALGDLDEKYASGKITQKQYEEAVEKATAGSSDFLKSCVALAGKQGLSGLLAIMSASDEDFAALTEAIANCDGATSQMASTMLDNARGAVTIFKSSIEGLEITLWTLVSDSFTNTISKMTALVQKFQQADPKVQKVTLKFGALSAAAGPVLVVAGKLVKSLPSLVKAFSALTSPLGLVTAGLALFAVAAIDADNDIGKSFESICKNAKNKLTEFGSTIEGKISTVSKRIPALIKSLINGLNTLVPSVFEVGTKIITSLMNAITENAGDLAKLGTTIITTVVNGLADALPSLIPSAVDMVVTLSTAIIENVPTLVEAAINLMDGFKEGILNIEWTEVGQKILNAIKEAISGLDQIFTDWFTSSSETAKKQDWAGIGTSIIKMILEATTSIAEFAGKMITNICNALNDHDWSSNGSALQSIAQALMDGIKDAIPKLANVAVSIVSAISSLFTKEGAASQIMDAATGIASALIDGIADILPTLSEALVDIVSSIGEGLSNVNWSGIVGNLTTLGEAIINAVIAAVKGAGNVASGIITAIGDLISNAVNGGSLGADLSGFADMIINGIINGLGALGEVSVELVNAIGTMLSKINWSNVVSAATTIAEKIIDGIIVGFKTIGSVAVDLVTAIGDWFAKIDWTAVGDSATKIADVLIDGIIKGLNAIGEVTSDLVTAITEWLGKIDWGGLTDSATKIAEKLIDGIIQGFKALGTVTTDLVSAIGDWIAKIDWSQVADNAKKIAEVLINGIIEGFKAIGQVTTDFVNAIGEFISKIDWSGVADAAGTIAKTLIEGIIEGFKTIGEVDSKLITTIGEWFAKIDWTKVAESASKIADVLIDGIVQGFKALTEVSVDLVTAIGDVLGKIDWSALGDSAGTIGEKLIEGIVAGLRGIVNLGTDLAQAIVDVIGKIDWTSLGEGVVNLAQKLFDGIVEGAKTLVPDMTELVTAIGKGISEAAGALGELAGSLIGNIVKFILSPENWLKLLELGAEIVNGIATGIINLGASIIEGAWNFVSNTFKGLFQSLGITMSDEAEAALDEVHETVNEGGETIYADLRSIISHMKTLDASGMWGIYDADTLQAYITDFESVLESGNQEIIDQWSDFGWLANEQIQQCFSILVDTSASEADRARALIALNDLGLGQYISNEFYRANPLIQQAAKEMSDQGVTSFEEAFSQLGITIPDSVRSGMEAGMPYLEAASKAAVDAASTANDQATAEAAAKATGEGVIDELKGAEETGTPEVTAATESMTEAQKLALETLPDVAAITGEDTDKGLADAITNNSSTVTTAMDTLADEVVKAALEKMTYETGYQLGYDYVNATKEGIEAVDLATAMGTVVDGVVKASDGKLTAEAGSKLGKEYVGGIESGMKDSKISETAKTIADNAYNPIHDKLTSESGKSIGDSFFGAISTEAINAKDTIPTAAESVATGIKNAIDRTINEQNGKSAGNAYFNGIRSGMSEAKDLIVEITQAMAENVKVIAENTISSWSGQSIGLQFAYGIASGISSGYSNVVNAIVNLCRKAVAKAKEELDINSPSRVARDEIGMMFDRGLAEGLDNGIGVVEKAAGNVTDSLRDSFYISDPSRGTVYTSQQQARQNATETAAATAKNETLLEKADRIGKAIANRLIESGVLESDITMDGTAVGRKSASSVSKEISRKSKQSVTGRSLQGVIA